MNSLNRLAVRGALVCALLAPAAAFAQGAPAAAPAAPPAPAPLVVPNPVYDTIELEQMVNKPAKEVWAKVGKFCDIEAWFGLKCVITAGQEGKLGAVRTLNGTTIEPIVSMTELSYVYTQPVRPVVTRGPEPRRRGPPARKANPGPPLHRRPAEDEGNRRKVGFGEASPLPQ